MNVNNVNVTQRYRKSNGLCISCAKPLNGGLFVTCLKCREGVNEFRKYLISQGVCPVCRHASITTGFKTCKSCRVRQRVYGQKRKNQLKESKNDN